MNARRVANTPEIVSVLQLPPVLVLSIMAHTHIREKIPPLRPRVIFDPPTWGSHGLVIGMFDCGPSGRRFESAS